MQKGELIDFLEARWHQMKSKSVSEMEHVLMKDYESKNDFLGGIKSHVQINCPSKTRNVH